MTTLSKPVRRTLPELGVMDRPLVVEMTPAGIRIREKGRRKWFGPYPWGRLYVALARLEADRIIAERKAARLQRSRAKR